MKTNGNCYGIIESEVTKFWKKNYPCDVIVFFRLKYALHSVWKFYEELVLSNSSSDPEAMEFNNDFCELLTTDIEIISIIPLTEITDFYSKYHGYKV